MDKVEWVIYINTSVRGENTFSLRFGNEFIGIVFSPSVNGRCSYYTSTLYAEPHKTCLTTEETKK